MNNFVFLHSFKKTSFLSRAMRSHPTHPLNYDTGEDTPPRNSGGRTLRPNRLAIRGASLESILDNSAVFQEL